MMDIRTTHWIAALLVSIAAHALMVHLVYTPGGAGSTRSHGVAVELGARAAFSESIAAPAEPEPLLPPENSQSLPAAEPSPSQPPAALEPATPFTHLRAEDAVAEAGPEAGALAPQAMALDAARPAATVEQAIAAVPRAPATVHTDPAASVPPGEVAATNYPSPSRPQPSPPSDGAAAASEGGRPGPSNGGDTGLAEDYYAELAMWLGRHKRYPRRARKNGQEGTVEVEFVIDRDGRLLEHRILRGSGVEVLDDEALALIERAAPMPPIPDEMDTGSLTVTAPITFSLR